MSKANGHGGKRPGSGRKRITVKKRVVTVRLRPDQHANVRLAARAAGSSVEAFLRRCAGV